MPCLQVPIEGMLELLSPKQPLFECDADDKLVSTTFIAIRCN
jgi:hypothetical protein